MSKRSPRTREGDPRHRAGVPAWGRPFGARRLTAKPERERSDSSPRVRSARSVTLELAVPVYAAIAGAGTGTTRGGSGRTRAERAFPACVAGRPRAGTPARCARALTCTGPAAKLGTTHHDTERTRGEESLRPAAPDFRLRGAAPCSERPPAEGTATTARPARDPLTSVTSRASQTRRSVSRRRRTSC